MNKYQKALDVVIGCVGDYDDNSLFGDNIHLLQELVGKATPKTVIGLSWTWEGLVGNCPQCRELMRRNTDKSNLCKCGQNLVWRDDEEG